MFSFYYKNFLQIPFFLIIILLSVSSVFPFHILVRAQHIFNNDNDNDDDSNSKSLSNPFYMGLLAISVIIVLTILYYIANICYNSFLEQPSPELGPCDQVGLNPTILNDFPIFTYPNVAGHIEPMLGPLECAVCLSPYKEEQFLRLLPNCDHLFHLYCVDRWLEANTTCPVCRADLIGELSQSSFGLIRSESSQVESTCTEELGNGLGIGYDNTTNENIVEMTQEILDWQATKIWRSNSTGHTTNGYELEEDTEQFRPTS